MLFKKFDDFHEAVIFLLEEDADNVNIIRQDSQLNQQRKRA